MKAAILYIAGYFLSLTVGALMISAIGMFATLGYWHIFMPGDGARFFRLAVAALSFLSAAAIVSERHDWDWWRE